MIKYAKIIPGEVMPNTPKKIDFIIEKLAIDKIDTYEITKSGKKVWCDRI